MPYRGRSPSGSYVHSALQFDRPGSLRAPEREFQWLDLQPFLIFRFHGLPHDPFRRGRLDIRHPSGPSLIRGSGCPDPRIVEGLDRRMTAIGRPCLPIRVAPELRAWKPQVDVGRPVISTFTRDTGCPVSQVGETHGRALFPLHTSVQVPGCPKTFFDVRSVERHRPGASHVFPGCPENPCGDIPDDQDHPLERSLFPGRVTPSFSQGIPREHLVGRNLIIRIGLPRS